VGAPLLALSRSGHHTGGVGYTFRVRLTLIGLCVWKFLSSGPGESINNSLDPRNTGVMRQLGTRVRIIYNVGGEGGRKMRLKRTWFRLGFTGGLILLAAFCFVRYVDWAFSYSATSGLASRAQETRLANHLAWMFLCMFIALELFSAFVIGARWEYPDLGSAWLRFSARYGLALLLSLLATGIVVGLWLASGRFI
jgi:hypothetical protein